MDSIKTFEPLFGDWYVESFIGAGSFGRVYRIYREESGKRTCSALKYISIPAESAEIKQLRMDGMDDRSISTYYSELTKSISEETKLMGKLRGNPNIVFLEDSKIIPKQSGIGYDIFIRMELLSSITEKIIGGGMTVAEVVKMGADLCVALSVCGKNGIIHRDIKPDNIFISDAGDYKLGDFGIARQLEKTASFMSKKGTYNYMAPEVYKGEKYGFSCDTYSLGLVMYRLLNGGRLPFLPPAPQQITPASKEQAIVRRMAAEAIPAPIGADGALARIVLKACAFRQQDRYSSPEEMRADILKYQNETAIKAAQASAPVCPEDLSDNDRTVGAFTSPGSQRITVQNDPTGPAAAQIPTPQSPISARPAVLPDDGKTVGAFTSPGSQRITVQNAPTGPAAAPIPTPEGVADEATRGVFYSPAPVPNMIASGKTSGAIPTGRVIQPVPVDAGSAAAPEARNGRPKSKKKRVVIIAVAVLCLIALLVSAFVFLTPYVKYQNAMSLMNNGRYDDAKTAFKSLGEYRDSKTMVKECKYRKGMSLLDSGKYEKAVSIFMSLGGYKDSKEQRSVSMYQYVVHHKTRSDVVTYEYLKELKKSNYKDSAKIFDSLYSWKVTLPVWNHDNSNETISYARLDIEEPIYFHFKVTGGKPNEKTQIKYEVFWPDGSSSFNAFDSPFEDGETSWIQMTIYPDNLQGAYTDELRILIYDGNNNLLCDESVKVCSNG